MIGFLIARSGPLAGSTFELNERTLLGRCPQADVQLLEQEASRRHALILRQEDGSWRVGDLSSSNGTFVGKDRIGDHRLAVGEVLRLGKSTFEYREVEDSSSLAQMPEGEDLKLLSGPVDTGTRDLPVQPVEGAESKGSHRAREAHEGDLATASTGLLSPVMDWSVLEDSLGEPMASTLRSKEATG